MTAPMTEREEKIRRQAQVAARALHNAQEVARIQPPPLWWGRFIVRFSLMPRVVLALLLAVFMALGYAVYAPQAETLNGACQIAGFGFLVGFMAPRITFWWLLPEWMAPLVGFRMVEAFIHTVGLGTAAGYPCQMLMKAISLDVENGPPKQAE